MMEDVRQIVTMGSRAVVSWNLSRTQYLQAAEPMSSLVPCALCARYNFRADTGWGLTQHVPWQIPRSSKLRAWRGGSFVQVTVGTRSTAWLWL